MSKIKESKQSIHSYQHLNSLAESQLEELRQTRYFNKNCVSGFEMEIGFNHESGELVGIKPALEGKVTVRYSDSKIMSVTMNHGQIESLRRFLNQIKDDYNASLCVGSVIQTLCGSMCPESSAYKDNLKHF